MVPRKRDALLLILAEWIPVLAGWLGLAFIAAGVLGVPALLAWWLLEGLFR